MHDVKYRPIIGFEIHVQLATRTKLFCGCPVEFAAEPNSRVCPVCMGLPGALPVLNRTAVEHALRAGLALGCTVARLSKWDRKSYFYPDMPKNYQISQYDLPLSSDGRFDIPGPDGTTRSIGIIRAHLEEDAGKNLHEGLDHTRVDLNRAGTPLLEIVTRPDIADAEEAYVFCTELQRLVRHLGISEADMQKGQMRFEPNVNVAVTADGTEYRTPIAEIKNLNSFRSVRSAIAYEIDRQVRTWQADPDYTLDKVGKINLGWDDAREVTEFQRGKEESHDYRYFPDPDLAPVEVDDAWIDRLRRDVGELPLARQRRFVADYGMTDKDCDVILADWATGDLYDAAVAAGAEPAVLTKQFVGVWNHIASARGTTVGMLCGAGLQPVNGTGFQQQGGTDFQQQGGTGFQPVTADRIAELARLVHDGTISAAAAGTVAEVMLNSPDASAKPVIDIARDAGLIQERDESALAAWIDQAFAANPKAIEDALKNPKKAAAAVGFLRGQVMKISQGRADPRLAGDLIKKKLDEQSPPAP